MPAAVEEGSTTALRGLVGSMKYALLITRDAVGTLRSRPLMTLEWSVEGDAWFLVLGDARLRTELEFDAEVTLAYAAPGDCTFVSLAGRAELARGAAAWALWNAHADALRDGAPGADVLRLTPRKAEHWASAERLFERLTGDPAAR